MRLASFDESSADKKDESDKGVPPCVVVDRIGGRNLAVEFRK
jgi:hypothetical protein